MVTTCRDFEHHPLAQDTSAHKGNVPHGRGWCCSIINLTLNYEENLIRSLMSRGWCGSNANYDRWLRDSVVLYVTFTFWSFILDRMILCASFWLSSMFTKVTPGKSSHFPFKIQTIQSFVKSIFWYINIYYWCHSGGRRNPVLKDPLKVCVCSKTCLMSAHLQALFFSFWRTI